MEPQHQHQEPVVEHQLRQELVREGFDGEHHHQPQEPVGEHQHQQELVGEHHHWYFDHGQSLWEGGAFGIFVQENRPSSSSPLSLGFSSMDVHLSSPA